MAVVINETGQPVAEGARSRAEALPLLFMLGVLFLSPLLYDLAQRVVGRG